MPETATATGAAGDAALMSALPGGEMLSGAEMNLPEEPAMVADFTGDPEVDDPEEGEVENGKEAETEEKDEKGEKKDGDDDEDGDEDDEAKRAKEIEEVRKAFPEVATQLDSLATERDALKAEKEQLVTEVETLKASRPEPVLTPTPEQPLANVGNEEGLSFHAALAKDVKSWAMRNLANGGELPAELQARLEGKKPEEITEARTLTPEQVAGILERSDAMLTESIPQRREYLKLERETEEWVKQTYPDYLDSKKPEGQLFSTFLQQFPQVKQLPRWRSVLASLVRGHMEFEKDHKAREAAKAGKTSPAAEPKKAPVPPGRGSSGATPVKPVGSNNKPSRKPALKASMSAEDLAQSLQ